MLEHGRTLKTHACAKRNKPNTKGQRFHLYEVLRLGKFISFEVARGLGEGKGEELLLFYGCHISVWCDKKKFWNQWWWWYNTVNILISLKNV